MCSFTKVSQNVYQRECEKECEKECKTKCKIKCYKDDIRKKHKGYFNEIANALMIEKELPKLKKGKNFVFKEQGAKLLEDLLYQYGQSMKRKKRSDVSKNLEKQIFKCDQYNAFLQEDILEVFDDMISANNLVIEALECFYQLFRDRGVTETEVGKILGKANTKYSYPKRKYFQEIIELFEWYIGELDKVNKQRHQEVGLTEQENTAWLEYSNAEIRNVMKKMLMVRRNMEKINEEGLITDVLKSFVIREDDEIEKFKCNEEQLFRECYSDREVQSLLKDYRMITNEELDFEKMVSLVVLNEAKSCGENEDLLMRELLPVSTDGNVILSQTDIKGIREILYSLYNFILREKNNYQWPAIFEEKRKSRESDKELLDEAIKMLDTPQ